MTRYAVDHGRRTLIAQWSTGIGDISTTVAEEVPLTLDILRLTTCLTDLSQVCWRCYTHPASAAEDHEPQGVGWQRQLERDAFVSVLPNVLTPLRPLEDPAPLEETRVGKLSYRTGRILRTIGSPELTASVAAEVTTELAAVEQAELGDLTARAQQAVTLSREDASPLQVAQADSMLQQQPFGTEALFTMIDPTAAAIAAAHWLHAAAITSAKHIRRKAQESATEVEVEQVRGPAHDSLSEVIAAMNDGLSPRHAVMPMIRNALHAAEGNLCGITEARQRIDEIEKLSAQVQPGTAYLPITRLDPARPAVDLLENLLYGIRSCWLLYSEHADLANAVESAHDLRQRLNTETFLTEVRKTAAATRENLL
jgi:hypothetical protein